MVGIYFITWIARRPGMNVRYPWFILGSGYPVADLHLGSRLLLYVSGGRVGPDTVRQ